MLTIIVPTYNERDNIAPLWGRLRSALGKVPFEVVFIDDSTDGTDRVICCLRQRGPARPAGPPLRKAQQHVSETMILSRKTPPAT